MDKKKALIEKLKKVLSLIESVEVADYEQTQAINMRVGAAHSTHPSLVDFDKEHEEQYVRAHMGPIPVKPDGAIKLLIPVYLVQLRQYNDAKAKYREQEKAVREEYKEFYKAERQALIDKDDLKNEEAKKQAEAKLAIAKEKLEKAEQELAADQTVADSLKKKPIIRKVLSYLEEDRVDTLRDAVNLFYDEERKDAEARKADEHRKEMLKLEKEKVRAAQAAEEYQRKQYEVAKETADSAERAANAAEMVWINDIVNSDK